VRSANAASLQQANIVLLLAMGTAAGLPFYTMPFVPASQPAALLRCFAAPGSMRRR
jgi:hypothetical protein